MYVIICLQIYLILLQGFDASTNIATPTTSGSNQQLNDEETSPSQVTTNNHFQVPPLRSKADKHSNDFTTEALQCMKSLSEAVTKRDGSTIFGEFVADSLRSSNRSYIEIHGRTLAKQHISEALFNLQKGLYATQSSTYQQSYYTTASVNMNTPHHSESSHHSDLTISSHNSDSGSLNEGAYTLSSFVQTFNASDAHS